MSIQESSTDKHRWLYGITALLAFLLVIETGILLRHKSHVPGNDKTSENRLYEIGHAKQRKTLPATSFQTPSSPANTASNSVDPFSDDWDWDQAFASMREMQEHMNRLMNMTLAYGPSIAHNLSQGGNFDFAPSIDIRETDKAYIVQSDLPGLEKDKISVSVENQMLTIQGIREAGSETSDEKSGFYAQERSYGSFARTVALPGPVDESNINAEYKNGVLTITLPKAVQTKTSQKVPVQ